MAEGKGNGGGETLSLQTLVGAAGASAVAAIVGSPLWKDGTVLAPATAPGTVATSRERLSGRMESELVRKPVQQVGRLASGRIVVPGRTGGRPSEESRVLPPPDEPPPQPENGGAPPHGDGQPLTPIRTY